MQSEFFFIEVTYHTKELSFDDDASVINRKTQLGRRNLPPEQRRFLIGNFYGTEKSGRGDKRGNTDDEGGRFAAKSHDDTLRSEEKESEDTAERIAKEQHVSRASVLRGYCKVVKTIYELSHGFFDKTVRYRIAPLIERKEGFFGTDPYENTKRVFQKMEAETKRREQA